MADMHVRCVQASILPALHNARGMQTQEQRILTKQSHARAHVRIDSVMMHDLYAACVCYWRRCVHSDDDISAPLGAPFTHNAALALDIGASHILYTWRTKW